MQPEHIEAIDAYIEELSTNRVTWDWAQTESLRERIGELRRISDGDSNLWFDMIEYVEHNYGILLSH